MSANSFKFVSPGVFVNEIDESRLPRQFEDIGPVIIGRSEKGPMMRPVKVQSMLEFEQLFGLPLPGNQNTDVWREGNHLAPTYGAYAAEAYLKNSGPVTFVRLGGLEDGDAGEKTGWESAKALGLFVAEYSGSSITGSAKLAAIIYTTGGDDCVRLSGSSLNGTGSVDAVSTWTKFDSTNVINVHISGSNIDRTITTSIGETSNKSFIRKALNTTPQLTNANVSSETLPYWLGETFESQTFTASAVGAILIPLTNGSDYKKNAETAKTGWVFSQHKGVATDWNSGSAGLYPVQNLFRFHTLSEDEHVQNSVKVSIMNVKEPANKYTDFGTFSVVVREMKDLEPARMILERFDQCTLDPGSPNFISKKIGDRYTTWDDDEKRFVEYGSYDNRSKYIRVEVDLGVESGVTDKDLLPFGFYGPVKFSDVVANSTSGSCNLSGSASFLSGTITGSSNFSTTFEFPTLPVQSSTTLPKAVCFGMKSSLGNMHNPSIPEYIRAKPGDLDATIANGSLTKYSFVFSIDDIAVDTDPPTVGAPTSASWAQGNRQSGTSWTSMHTGSYLDLLNVCNKFTMPLVGGFEGLDITEKEPFNNTLLEGTYALKNVQIAIDAVSDPEVVEMSSLVIPGIKNAAIHEKMISTCETRGDSLAIIDIAGDYTPSTENKNVESDRKPNVTAAVAYVKDTLSINSSYGCAFFPWVLVRDANSSNTLWVPPSVVALGTFGSTKKNSEVWFAPAGFTRGGLSQGAGGLSVVGVSLKVNSKERDKLYEANINPIASFPSEGIVVFGQKTLQVTPSALDRINVRRLMNYVKKEISRMSSTLLFDPNVQVTWDRFTGSVNPFLRDVQSRLGITEFKVVLDETTTTPDLIDRNIMYAKILLKPARAIEFIALDFTVSSTGASFAD